MGEEQQVSVGQGPIEVGVLTDEELAVVAGSTGVGAFPVLDLMPEDEQAVALRTAYRSLVARGIVEPGGPEEIAAAQEAAEASGATEVELTVRLPESMAAVIAIRQAASQVVAVARTTSLGDDYRYGYVFDETLLVEEVSAAGAHHFTVRPAEHLERVVLDWAINPDAGDGHGDPVEVPPLTVENDPRPPQELLEQLGTALLRADVVIHRRGVERAPLVGVFSGPTGTWVSVAHFGSGDPVVIRPVSVADARRVLSEQLDG